MRQLVNDGCHDENGSSGTNNDRRHAAKKRKKATRHAGSQDALDRSNTVVHVGAVDRTKRQGRSNDGNEHEERNTKRLLIKVGHLLHPVGSHCALQVRNNALSPRLRRVCVYNDETRTVGSVINGVSMVQLSSRRKI